MAVKAGMLVTIRHYSMINVFKSVVINADRTRVEASGHGHIPYKGYPFAHRRDRQKSGARGILRIRS